MQNFRFVGLAFLLASLAPLTRADATLRYHTDIQTAALIPAAALDQTLGGMRDMVVRIKGNKASSSLGKLTSIVDLMTQEMILVNTENMRFATTNVDQYGQQAKTALPAVPAEARAILSSMKSHFESRSTGRTEVIQGIQAEEQDFVLSMDMAIPGGPAAPGPFMTMVMQVWTAKPEEFERVPALREFQSYATMANVSLNSTEVIKQILTLMPGISDGFTTMTAEMSKKGAVSLRMRTEVTLPVLATMMQQVPAQARQSFPPGFDPSAPLIQMTQELVELSSDPLENTLFVVPADYQKASFEELLKSAIPASPAAARQ